MATKKKDKYSFSPAQAKKEAEEFNKYMIEGSKKRAKGAKKK